MSSDASSSPDSPPATPRPKDHGSGEYVVVARRYRPRSFEELVGQSHVAQALSNAITSDRVGHAYLFTGARGVGKTSTARIFAKALNDPAGPTPTPDGESDIAQAIDSGEDVDVLEIDGASNRGIDEIRQLRANVNIRPCRSRFKIYIIDEVHMLTTAAFNALLKTLEEPPLHVKFIFCTTDPEKIPITVLSRCQRFDFAPVETNSIIDRLRFIVDQENARAEQEALRVLARRAGGSMRDSQSLLEQLLSFCGDEITLDDVHALLGTARGGRLEKLAGLLGSRDAAGALAELDAAVAEGVDLGQLAEQLLGYYRDMMAATVGCDAQLLRHTNPDRLSDLAKTGNAMGLQTVLATLQILDQAVTRMRQTTLLRTLLEMTLVRICNLEQLDEIGSLIEQLQGEQLQGASASPAVRPAAAPPSRPLRTEATPGVQKKKADTEIAVTEPPIEGDTASVLTTATAPDLWKQALADLGDMTADAGGFSHSIAITAPNRLVVTFGAQYTLQKETCERRKTRIEQALAKRVGQTVRVDFAVAGEAGVPAPNRAAPTNRRQQIREKENHPFVKEAIELFDAEIIRLESAPKTLKNAETGRSTDQA